MCPKRLTGISVKAMKYSQGLNRVTALCEWRETVRQVKLFRERDYPISVDILSVIDPNHPAVWVGSRKVSFFRLTGPEYACGE